MTYSIIIPSAIDKSVNFVEPQDNGFIEARYVRRSPDYAIFYVSSQTGCNRGCKFCHLTTSDQKVYRDCTLEDYLAQIDTVIEHYKAAGEPCEVAHCNFMSRGEAMANRNILNFGDNILYEIGARLLRAGLRPKFNLSTIMPKTFKGSLAATFPLMTPTIYYSLYSVDADWRARWMPGAMPVDQALDVLREYQSFSKKIIKLHGAFIDGENDDVGHVRAMLDIIETSGLRCEYNIVAYNPFSEAEGRSASPERIQLLADLIADHMPVKIVGQVGRDCGASCGSFYPVHDLTKRDGNSST